VRKTEAKGEPGSVTIVLELPAYVGTAILAQYHSFEVGSTNANLEIRTRWELNEPQEREV
jgi:hypothetical protein